MVEYGKFPKGYELDDNKELNIGDMVLDELTFTVSKILTIAPIEDIKNCKGEVVVKQSWKGNWYQVEHPYLEGWRYDWELSKVRIKQ